MRRTLVSLLLLVSSAGISAGQSLAERVAAVTDRPEYRHGRWGILVVDVGTGEVILERNPDQSFAPASTTKLFSCAAVLGELGKDFRFRTRLLSDGVLVDGTLFGGITLVASGDPTMGGRNRPDGTMAFVNGDHTYADASSTTAGVTATNPLAGLEDLARQLKNAGVREIRGDVAIDDRLFDSARSSGSGPDRVTPISINDNVLDFLITAGPRGAEVAVRPANSLLQVDNRVVVEGKSPNVSVVQEGPWSVSLRGNVPAGEKTYVRILPINEPAVLARSLLIQCLEREGVRLSVSSLNTRLPALPDLATGTEQRTVAEHVSLPLHEVTKVTLKVSHNLYASTLPLLIASKHKERTLSAGLARQGIWLRQLGVDSAGLSFAGGAGGANADSVTPRGTVDLLRKMRGRPDFTEYHAGLPVLGVDGTLADVVASESPARGKVQAKTGTLFWADLMNGRLTLRSKALAGYMTTARGRELAFSAFINDAPLPPGKTPALAGRALGEICELIYQHSP